MAKKLIHRHFVARVFLKNPPMAAEIGENWLRELVRLVEMQILLDAKGIYCEDLGNEGVTGIVGLTTSHASFHSWHEVEKPFMMFDLYSCQHFETATVAAHLDAFGVESGIYSILDRETGAIVEKGTLCGGTHTEIVPE